MSQSTKAGIKVISGGAFKQVLNALAEQYEQCERQQARPDLSDRRPAFEIDRKRRRAIRRRRADARRHRRPDQGRQGGCRQPRRSGQDRRRRRGQGRHAVARHQFGRRLQAHAAGGKIGGLYRSGGRRLERHLCRKTVGAARHRRRNQCQGEIDPWRRGRRSHRRRARPRSACIRSARYCRSRASCWSVRCRRRSRISRSIRPASPPRPRTALTAQCAGQVPGRAARGADHQGQGHGAGIVSVPKSQRPHEAGAEFGVLSFRKSGFRVLPGEPRNVRTGDADIGQFAVVEARKFPAPQRRSASRRGGSGLPTKAFWDPFLICR